MAAMDLILLESVEGLGRPGDQVSVKPGYARNYLLPHRKALPVGPEALRSLGKLKAKADAEERAMISSMEELAAKIAGTRVAISARATDEGHLFGSITEKDIHTALVAHGWDVPTRAVRLEAHLKEAGDAEVELHLYGAIVVAIVVEVVPMDSEGNPIEQGGDEQADAEAGDAEASEAGPEAAEQPASTPEVG